jgi:hypothetical protein
MSEAPFVDVPSGVDLARYFWHETDHQNPGCDGIDLWRDGADYCYLWVEAMADHDLFRSYLLDVRTKREGTETRDFLFLHVGIGERFEVEWHQHPTRFEDDSMDRVHDGLLWFVSSAIAALERS